jgi:hypothetical protein
MCYRVGASPSHEPRADKENICYPAPRLRQFTPVVAELLHLGEVEKNVRRTESKVDTHPYQLDASFLTFPLKDLDLSSLRLISVITLLRPSLLPLPVPSTHAYYSVRRCSLCRCPPAPGLLFSGINAGLDFLELRWKHYLI